MLWDVESGKLKGTLEGHTDQVFSVAISPDGRYVAAGGWDNTVRVWELRSGELLQTFHGHEQLPLDLAFSPDGNTLASAGGWDGTTRLWDVSALKK